MKPPKRDMPLAEQWASLREDIRLRAQNPTEDFPYGLYCFYLNGMLTWKFWLFVASLSFAAWFFDIGNDGGLPHLMRSR